MHSIVEKRYSLLKKRLDNEIIEPAWGWGFRVAISVILPTILSIYTGNHDYFWMIIAAETVSIVELKGSAGLRSRLLIAALSFSVLFTIIGSLVGLSPYLAVLLLFPVAFATGLMKNLGDWGLALALNIYLFYLIASNHPAHSWPELMERTAYVALGGVWAMAVGIFSFSFLPQGKPYRRTIAHIWLAVEQLVALVANSWDTKAKRSSVRAIYLKEKDIRKAIDESIAQFSILYGNKQNGNKTDQQLSYARRCASLASLQIISVAELSEKLFKDNLDPLFKAQIFSILKVLEQMANRMGFFFYTTKDEELLLLQSRLKRLEQFQEQLKKMPDASKQNSQDLLLHISRFSRLVRISIQTISGNKEGRIYQQYSLLQTLNILHPKHLIYNIRQFINFDNLTLKYALRMAIAAMFSYLIGVLYLPEHSYWLPLTTIIVTQPFFGATLKRGIERSIGTVAGVVAGGLLLMLPFAFAVRYVLIFFGAILMIYNLRKNYAWAAFFISLFLIGLMSTGDEVASSLIIERIVATIIGGAISIISGFILFPAWDKKLLPNYLTQAIAANYKYFIHLFYDLKEEPDSQNWVQYKIAAESSNSNAYDSLNRYLTEPKYREKNLVPAYFTAITYNIRITRELNFYQDDKEAEDTQKRVESRHDDSVIPMLTNIHYLFQQSITLLEQRYKLDIGINWAAEKTIKSTLEPSEHQWQCVERLYIELKALNSGLIH